MSSDRKISFGSRGAGLIVLTLTVLTLILIPIKIIGGGYLPPDDALSHAAKAVSGKSWDEILVLRDGIKMDIHPGWNAILGVVHRITRCEAYPLVAFSLLLLFFLFTLPGLFFLRRPEAWLASLLVVNLASTLFPIRLMSGRPYLITASSVLILCFMWLGINKERLSIRAATAAVLIIALAVWMHASWYLFLVPLAGLLIARKRRLFLVMSICAIAGVALGALATGNPIVFLKQTACKTFLTLGAHQADRLLVAELRPFRGELFFVIAAVLLLGWRTGRGDRNTKLAGNPVFSLVVLSWILGFVVQRFWLDIGVPAAAAWMACEFQDHFERGMDPASWRRVFAAIFLASALYLSFTSDAGSRWTENLTAEYLSPGNPEQAQWLPEDGGIIYSDDMSVFFQTFFKNPTAPWRYILGFEPAIMPPDDLAIYRNIQWNFKMDQSYAPWVRKMRPADRLIMRRPPGVAPQIPGLEWRCLARGLWSGRVPRR